MAEYKTAEEVADKARSFLTDVFMDKFSELLVEVMDDPTLREGLPKVVSQMAQMKLEKTFLGAFKGLFDAVQDYPKLKEQITPDIISKAANTYRNTGYKFHIESLREILKDDPDLLGAIESNPKQSAPALKARDFSI